MFSKSNISIVLAVLALAVSAVTLYLMHLRSIEVTLSVSSVGRVSNARGGLPDIYVDLELSGQGPTTKYVSVQEIEGRLYTVDGEKCSQPTELVTSNRVRVPPEIPATLNGGEKKWFPRLLLVDVDHNSPPSARIRRHGKWCAELKAAAPTGMEDRIGRVCNAFDDTDEGTSYGMLCKDGKNCEPNLDNEIAGILAGVELTKLRDLLYFRAGVYELEIRAILGDGRVGASDSYRFEIKEEDSQILLEDFNVNLPFHMEKNDMDHQCVDGEV